jgi:hypothetical protein
VKGIVHIQLESHDTRRKVRFYILFEFLESKGDPNEVLKKFIQQHRYVDICEVISCTIFDIMLESFFS